MIDDLIRSAGLEPTQLPAVNAALNSLCTGLLIAGWTTARRRLYVAHKYLMIAAFTTSVVFLASYLYYHFAVKAGVVTRFPDVGWPRVLYLLILTTHTFLAVAVAVMAPVTLYLGFGAPGNSHTRWSRVTMPIWLYVSATGVVVYWMLYHLYPPGNYV